MKERTEMPSYLALDRQALEAESVGTTAGDSGLPGYAREHLQRLREQVPMPERLRALAQGAPSGEAGESRALGGSSAPRTTVVSWRRHAASAAVRWAALGALAAALAIGLFPRDGATPDRPYVGTKGAMPAVAVYVKRSQAVRLWNGEQALQPGDVIRLEVMPERFFFVTVVDAGDPGGVAVLYQGPVSPQQRVALPAAWQLDGEAGDEHLLVVFSDGPIGEGEARAMVKRPPDPRRGFVVPLRLKKRAPVPTR